MDVKDLDIQKEIQLDIGSTFSDLSILTKRSQPSSNKTKSSPRTVCSISSRARPIKEYENQGSTFLSVDMKPEDNIDVNNKKDACSVSKMSQQSGLTTRASSVMSTRGQKSVADLDISKRLMSSGLLRPLSSKAYTLLLQNSSKSNIRVKMPFKHNTNKPEVTNMIFSPGREMSERTVLATSVISKILREQKPPKISSAQGRLLKARLKPLEPVLKTTPTIQQCRGIIAETRAYSASNSRTFQRWKAILSGEHSHTQSSIDIKDNISVDESVHRTSEVSSPVPSLDQPAELDHGLNKKPGKVNDRSSNHLIKSPEGMEALKENLEAERVASSDKENSAVKSAVDSQIEVKTTETSTLKGFKNNDSKRPHSAYILHDSSAEISLRPKTVGEKVRPKSVRFVDDIRMSSTDKVILEKQKARSSRTSCRPFADVNIPPDDENDPGYKDGSHLNGHFQKTVYNNAGVNSVHQGDHVIQTRSDSKSQSDQIVNNIEPHDDLGQTTVQIDQKRSCKPRPLSVSVLYEQQHSTSLSKNKVTSMDIKQHLNPRFSKYKKKDQLPNYSSSSKEVNHKELGILQNDTEEISPDKIKSYFINKTESVNYPVYLPPKGNSSKVYKRLNTKKLPKTKVRPYSASACVSEDIALTKPRVSNKTERPVETNLFSERAGILCKHGLLKKKRPSSAPCLKSKQDKTTAINRLKSPTKPKSRQVKHKKCSSQEDVSREITAAEQMWEDLPTDDGFTDDPFLSKFDQLDTELESTKAQLQAMKIKYLVKEENISNNFEIITSTKEEPKGSCLKIPTADVDEMAGQSLVDVMLDEASTPVNTTNTEGEQSVELKAVTVISSSLYRKTNLFTPVSNRKLRRPGSSKCLSINDESERVKADSLEEKSANSSNDIQQVENINLQIDKLVTDLDTTVSPMSVSFNENVSMNTDTETLEHRLQEIRQQLEKDYPLLTQMLRDEMSHNQADSSELYPDERRSSETDSVCEGELFPSLLKAYRNHFEYKSDDGEDDILMTKSKKAQLHQKPSQHHIKKDHSHRRNSECSLKNTMVKEILADSFKTSAMNKTRLWSGTTNDSGRESDSLLNSEDEELTSATIQTQLDSKQEIKNTQILSYSLQEDQRHVLNHSHQEDLKNGIKCSSFDLDTEMKHSRKLEVVAKPKKLSQPRIKHKMEEEDMSTLCQVPPLCFRLTARPPSGYLFYFAYDQNMGMDRMCSYLSENKTLTRFWALLFGFELVFNKKAAVDSHLKEVGGFPNLVYNAASSVEGCLYQLTSAQLQCLDKFMSYPRHCEHIAIPVWMSNCLTPDELGVAQFCVPAVTYIAKDEVTWTDPIEPNNFALSQCVQAADLLTPAYRDHLTAMVQHQPDQGVIG